MTNIIDRLLDEAEKAQRKGHLLLAEVCRDASDQLGLVMEERDRLRNALLIADTACRSYWGWEYGRPGDVDDDDVPDSSLLVKWRRDYEARAKLKENDQ
jgi:hypothetical protein